MTGTGLKLLALVLMLVDHIGEFIPGTPVWLNWLGRLSAPLFFFCAAQGLAHTHDRRKYLLRLYICGVIMAVLDLACNNLAAHPYMYIYNNIFVTIFSFALLVELIELWRRDRRRGWLYAGLYALMQIAAYALPAAFSESPVYGMSRFIGSILGSAVTCEGGVPWVLLGTALYWAQDDRKKLIITYLAFSLFFFVSGFTPGAGLRGLLYYDYQWMMVLALPLMLLYNGRRGIGLKYLFYVFYPAHIVLLFFIGNSMQVYLP